MFALVALLLLPSVLATNHTLSRRYSNIRMTNYFAGEDQGACGAWHQDSEFVVALSHQNFNNGQYCNKQVTISYNGKTGTGIIVDECMGCPEWGLDLSQSFFGHFVGGQQNNNLVGVIQAEWSFGGSAGNNGDNGDNGAKKTTTTTKPTPKPTTTSTTHTPPTTTSTTPKPSSSTSPVHSESPSKSAAHSASPSASPSTPAGPQNLDAFTGSLVNLLGLVVQAGHAA
ncbi:hypothetical protein MIND_00000800 [Mycena indigotica]|uniref:Uncharacterized protein n=1 Tax=Mycena indigotica TaxID=2126181 RepID=A0A8H6TCE4_9AGAR|nr:uncharacterized protein MIND_00000800 [Mycena indigotica]KAF7314871.1 hypothetical protein MIND_00000800 [Mycena indigotica]